MKRKLIIPLILVLLSLFISDSITEARGGSVSVKGYTRKDGTYVAPHMRSAPDGNPYNNWSYPGNTNPYTGKVAPGNPETYLDNYYKRKGGTNSAPKILSPLPVFTSPLPINYSPKFQPLPESNNSKGTGLESLFGTKQHAPIKQRSGSLNDVF
jgi:hypothetical protein